MEAKAIKKVSNSLKIKQLLERKNYTSGYTNDSINKCFKIGKLIMEKASSNVAIRMNYMVSESENESQDFGEVFLNVNTHEGEKFNRIEVIAKNPMICVTEFFLKMDSETSTEVTYSFYVALKQHHSKVDLCINNKYIMNSTFIYIEEADAEDYATVINSGGLYYSVVPNISITDNSVNNKINYWAEIGRIRFTDQWQECDLILDVINTNTGNVPLRGGRIYIRGAQGYTLPTEPQASLGLSANLNIDKEDIKAIVTADTTQSFIRIFIKVRDSYSTYVCKPSLITDASKFTLYEKKPLIENLPVGSVVNCQ